MRSPSHFLGPVAPLVVPWVRAAVYLTSVVLAVAWGWYAGKCLPWDMVHYHVYSGFSALHDRFGRDFMAAGPQSYLNPYALIPAYWLVTTSLPPVVAASLLAVAHTVNVWLVFEIGLLWCRDEDAEPRLAPVLCGWLLTLIAPLFLAQVGTSYADIVTSMPVLAAVLLCALRQEDLAWRNGLAGLLMGVAVGLKISNVIFAVAIAVGMLAVARGGWQRLRPLLHYAAGGGIGLLLSTGWWSWRLWQEFGNPVFPMFNGIFGSPYAAAGGDMNMRFGPATWTEALLRPVYMLSPAAGVYTENALPDVRYLALFLAMAAAIGLFGWRSWRRRPPRLEAAPDVPVSGFTANRGLVLACIAFLVSWVLWLLTSGNGRYFMPMAMLAGMLACALWWRVVANSGRAFWYPVLAVLLCQTAMLSVGGRLRWTQDDWTERWLDVTVPDRFRDEPYLFLATDSNSRSSILPWLHPDSGMVNVGGQIPLGPESPGWKKVEGLLRKQAGRVRLLSPVPDASFLKREPAEIKSAFDPVVGRLGFEINANDCELIELKFSPRSREPSGVGNSRFVTSMMVSCALTPSVAARRRYEQAVVPIDTVLNRIEDRCPELFSPARPLTEQWTNGWSRYYTATDMRVYVTDGRVFYIDTYRLGPAIEVGRVDDWIRPEGGNINCALKSAPVPVDMEAIIQQLEQGQPSPPGASR